MTKSNGRRRARARFSRDGQEVFVTLRVDRRCYEFARACAEYHALRNPGLRPEHHLEGCLQATLWRDMALTFWKPPPEIEALYTTVASTGKPQNPLDDGIPF